MRYICTFHSPRLSDPTLPQESEEYRLRRKRLDCLRKKCGSNDFSRNLCLVRATDYRLHFRNFWRSPYGSIALCNVDWSVHPRKYHRSATRQKAFVVITFILSLFEIESSGARSLRPGPFLICGYIIVAIKPQPCIIFAAAADSNQSSKTTEKAITVTKQDFQDI